jgi:hypothetical protein
MGVKKILCIDFDGVLHSYTSGWMGADIIPDAPVPGAIPFLLEAMKHFKVAIYSSRSHMPGGIEEMKKWLYFWAFDPTFGMPDKFEVSALIEIDWPTEKPAAFVTLDDRAITFTGIFPDPADLVNFRPWNK